MSHAETFAEAFTMPANTTDSVAVTTRPEGTDFRVGRVDIVIEAGAPIDVEVSILAGQAREAPEVSSIGGGGQVFEVSTDFIIPPTGSVDARFDNPTTNSFAAQVLVHGSRV